MEKQAPTETTATACSVATGEPGRIQSPGAGSREPSRASGRRKRSSGQQRFGGLRQSPISDGKGTVISHEEGGMSWPRLRTQTCPQSPGASKEKEGRLHLQVTLAVAHTGRLGKAALIMPTFLAGAAQGMVVTETEDGNQGWTGGRPRSVQTS